jgi:hypothetical protein
VSFPNVFTEIGCFRSGHPSARFWSPVSYSTRFSTVFIHGRFHPPIFRFYSFAYDSMPGCRFQTFHQNRLFSFRSPVSPFLHPVSYSTRFSNVFTRGRFHPSLFRLPPFAYYSMYGCRFQTFSPKSAVFRSGRPSAHFWPPESYSTRFSTVFTRGRFHPSIFRLLPFAYDSMSGCHFQTFSPKSVVFVSVALQPVFGLPCTRFSTVLACGRFYPSMIHLHPYAYDSISGCHL